MPRADAISLGLDLKEQSPRLAALPGRGTLDFSELNLCVPSSFYSDTSNAVTEIGRIESSPLSKARTILCACPQSRVQLIEVGDALLDGVRVAFHFIR
jgi:hypothetical protein